MSDREPYVPRASVFLYFGAIVYNKLPRIVRELLTLNGELTMHGLLIRPFELRGRGPGLGVSMRHEMPYLGIAETDTEGLAAELIVLRERSKIIMNRAFGIEDEPEVLLARLVSGPV